MTLQIWYPQNRLHVQGRRGPSAEGLDQGPELGQQADAPGPAQPWTAQSGQRGVSSVGAQHWGEGREGRARASRLRVGGPPQRDRAPGCRLPSATLTAHTSSRSAKAWF